MIETGVYKHYAGRFYYVEGIGEHTETGEEMVVYVPLYCHPNGGRPKRIRPLKLFTEKVKWPDGVMRPRFIWEGTHVPKKQGVIMPEPKTRYVMQCFVPVGEIGILYCAENDFQPVTVPLCIPHPDGKLFGNAGIQIGAALKFHLVAAYQEYMEENPLTLKPAAKHKCIGSIEIYGTIVVRKIVAPDWWSERESIPEKDK